MHVENRPPPPTPSSVLCLCLCLCFFSVTSFTSVFVSSKSHIFTFKTFFFTNSDGKDTYFFYVFTLDLMKKQFLWYWAQSAVVSFLFYFILYQNSTMLYPLIHEFYFPVACFLCIHFCLRNWTCILWQPWPNCSSFFPSSGIHKDCYFTSFWKVLSLQQINRIAG